MKAKLGVNDHLKYMSNLWEQLNSLLLMEMQMKTKSQDANTSAINERIVHDKLLMTELSDIWVLIWFSCLLFSPVFLSDSTEWFQTLG